MTVESLAVRYSVGAVRIDAGPLDLDVLDARVREILTGELERAGFWQLAVSGDDVGEDPDHGRAMDVDGGFIAVVRDGVRWTLAPHGDGLALAHRLEAILRRLGSASSNLETDIPSDRQGTVLPNEAVLPDGTVLPAGTILPVGTILPDGTVVPERDDARTSPPDAAIVDDGSADVLVPDVASVARQIWTDVGSPLDPGRLRLALESALGPIGRERHRADLHLIVVAAEEGIPTKLQTGGTGRRHCRRLAGPLAKTRHWTDDAAARAIDLWVEVLTG